jgi:hypothetical protein
MTTDDRSEALCSLRGFLIIRAIDQSSGTPDVLTVVEAVASTAMAHPEWPDLESRATWAEWSAWEAESLRS